MARYQPGSWILAIVIFGLMVLCAPAQAQQFSAPKNVSNNSDFSFTPVVAVDSNGTIYMAWEDDTDTNSNILLSRSTDGGLTFSTPINVSNTPGFSFNPRIAVGSAGNVNIAWQNFTTGNTIIMNSHSTNAGVSFSTALSLSNASADSGDPQIAADAAGNVYVVWDQDSFNLGIFFSRSTDGGATFSAPAPLSTNASGSVSPQIAIGLNGNLTAVWEDDTAVTSDISFSHSADHGATFSIPESLSLHTGNSMAAQIATDVNGNVDVVWANDSTGHFNIFFSRSTDNGATFSGPKDISNGTGLAENAQIGLDAKGNINVIWQDNTSSSANSDVYFSHSSDGGATFSSPSNVSKNAGNSGNPFLTIDAGAGINLAWEDDTPGNKDIFFSRSTDSGVTFSSLNLSTDAGLSLAPTIAADKNGINVTWQDATSGISQILFSRLSIATVANQPPVANAGPDQTIACSGPNGSSVTLDGSQSSDPDGDTLSFVWKDSAGNVVGTTATVQVMVSLGTHTFTLTVTDPGGLSSTSTTHVTVGDTTPPTIQVSLSPNLLWPPNHNLVTVSATVAASDSCDAGPAVSLVSITSSEPDNGLGDGDQPNDIQAAGGGPIPLGTDVRSFLLRAERSGSGSGRVYTVTYMVKNAAGNSASASATVLVPATGDPIRRPTVHSRMKKEPPRGRNHDRD